MSFILKMQCKEIRSSLNDEIMTREGQWVWITNGEWGTTSGNGFFDKIPGDVLEFESKEKAEKFTKHWQGHPWYYKPNGVWEILEVKPKFKQVQDGWEVL